MILLSSIEIGIAQEGSWWIGAEAYPYMYWNYNKAEFNNRPTSFPERVNQFNGVMGGISLSYERSYYGFRSGIWYSSQIQHHKSTYNSDPFDDPAYNVDFYRHFNYWHVPLEALFKAEIGYDSGLWIQASAGVQLSILQKALQVQRFYYQDPITREVTDQLRIENVATNTIASSCVDPGTSEESCGQPKVFKYYSSLVFGVLGRISLMKSIGRNCHVELGVRGDYAITASEYKKNISLTDQLRTGEVYGENVYSYVPKTASSHHIRLGPFLCLRWRLGG
jgi:hypothetical protein